jgi:hypothetical protein
MDFIMKSAPTPELPEQISQGGTIISTVSGLPYINNALLNYVKGSRTDVSQGGVAKYLDFGGKAKYSDVNISFELNTSNCAALINEFTNNVRGDDFLVTTMTGQYLFGAENGGNGVYQCQLTDRTIKVVHSAYNIFNVSLNLHLKERCA